MPDALVLLEQWQGEHERNELELLELAKERDLLLRALQDRTIAANDLHEETSAIKKRTRSAVGSAALHAHLIEQEEEHGQLLEEQIKRLTEETQRQQLELERTRRAAADEAVSFATALPRDRARHRQRCDDSGGLAKRARAELFALEAELPVPPPQQRAAEAGDGGA